MKNPLAAVVATAIPLLATSLPVSAGELLFNAPATVRASESALLLRQTARALYDLPSGAVLQSTSGKHISNLWLFPTADADTVFARYNLTSDDEAASGTAASATEHLAVLTVRGNRILESRDLTSAHTESASNEPAKLHWSATIGTGHAASTTVANSGVTNSGVTAASATSTSHGVPASPNWTARIGTGAAASTTTDSDAKQPTSSGSTQPVVAAAHWTSRIGTGHSSDSTSSVTHASLTNGG
jgi:hypothetical protein